MAITAQQIITRVQTKLNETGAGTRWPVASELLPALNTGRREIVRLNPLANAVTKNVQLVAGLKQTITGTVLLDAICNMGAAGATQGAPVRKIERKVLDDLFPGWMTATASGVVKYVIYDPAADPKTFYTYPQQPNPGFYLRLVQSEPPADVAIDAEIGLDDTYEDALFLFVMYDALSKSTEGGDRANAIGYLQAFESKFGGGRSRRNPGAPNAVQN